MNLTDAERLILYNQYQILAKLDNSGAEDYELLSTCLTNGYEQDFDQLLPHFEPPQSESVYRQVRDILEMFRALANAAGPENSSGARFAGFDGNEETDHYAYARFLLKERGLWNESDSNDLNTHTPVLVDYLTMLGVWENFDRTYELSPEQVQAIVESAPYACTH